MTKQEWQDLYNVLDKIYSDFLLAYPDYQNGRNKKIRADAARKIESSIRLAKLHIEKNSEIYFLLTGENNSDYGRAIMYDEFIMPQYFRNDMGDFLNKIKEKIKIVE